MEAVIRVVPRDDFSLELWFNTGGHRLFDTRPYLNRGVFMRLQDVSLFKQAFVALDTVCTVCWPGIFQIRVYPAAAAEACMALMCATSIRFFPAFLAAYSALSALAIRFAACSLSP